jgi:hypothetical protein
VLFQGPKILELINETSTERLKIQHQSLKNDKGIRRVLVTAA